MSNRKRKCLSCKAYKIQANGIVMPVGFFCKIECVENYAIKKWLDKIKKAQREKEKQEKEDRKQRKEKLKDRKWYLKKAQELVNQYVNLRDYGKPCISCGKPFGTHKRNASHYRSVGACKALRFNLWNIHSSCVQCNKDKSGNIVEYRISLVKKYGQKRVEWLEAQNGTKKLSIEYLQRLIEVFKKLIKRAKNHNMQKIG